MGPRAKILTDADITALLKKYKILKDRYDVEKACLIMKKDSAGLQAYTEKDIQRLILRKSSKNTVAQVLAHHDTLIALGCNVIDILKIACHDGGGKNIEILITVLTNLKDATGCPIALTELHPELTLEHLIQVISKHGSIRKCQGLIEILSNLKTTDGHPIRLTDLHPNLTLEYLIRVLCRNKIAVFFQIAELLKKAITLSRYFLLHASKEALKSYESGNDTRVNYCR